MKNVLVRLVTLTGGALNILNGGAIACVIWRRPYQAWPVNVCLRRSGKNIFTHLAPRSNSRHVRRSFLAFLLADKAPAVFVTCVGLFAMFVGWMLGTFLWHYVMLNVREKQLGTWAVANKQKDRVLFTSYHQILEAAQRLGKPVRVIEWDITVDPATRNIVGFRI